NFSVDEVTLAQALAALKNAKPKADKVMLQEPEQGTIIKTTAATPVTAASTRPKANGLYSRRGASNYTNSFFSATITGQGTGQRQRDYGRRTCENEKERSNQSAEELAFKLQA
ncbi:hypothetical protein Tco_1528997, partial [Tanacetum coccineum]